MSVEINVKTVKYCVRILYPLLNPYLFLIFLMIKFKNYNNKDRFKLIGLPRNIYDGIVRSNLRLKEVRDSSKLFIISEKLHRKLLAENIFYYDNGSVWMSICGEGEDQVIEQFTFLNLEFNKHQTKQKKKRIVQILGSKEIPDDVIACLNVEELNVRNLFWFNHEKEEVFLTLHPIINRDCVPRIAEKAIIHLVNDESEVSTEVINNLLHEYFENPKMVYNKDIFEVKVRQEYLNKHINSEKLYFHCSEASASCDIGYALDIPYFVVKGRTELKIAENVHSFMPFKRYLETKSIQNGLIDICPSGLKDNFGDIKKSMLPFLMKSLTNILHETTSQSLMPFILLTGRLGTGRRLLIKLIADYHGFHHMHIDSNLLQSSTFKQTEVKIATLLQTVKEMAPVVVAIDNFHKIVTDSEGAEDCRILDFLVKSLQNLFDNYTKYPIIFIAATTKRELSAKINRIFIEKHNLTKLDSNQTRGNVRWFINALNLSIQNKNEGNLSGLDSITKNIFRKSNEFDSCLERIASKLEGLSHGEMDMVFHLAQKNSYLRQIEEGVDVPDMCSIHEEDVVNGLEHLRKLQSQHVDRPKIPKVYWEDIGGLQDLKKELVKTIELPIKYPHLFKNTLLQRSGILLYGPPGCGKTLVAKAVSTELNISFLSVKGPELLNMYIGQSEENVRKVFESARQSAPCLVFLDELDSLAPRRGATGDSGGASDRVVSQLLAEIDGVEDTSQDGRSASVFVMGATNRPDLLEQSLLRPGRLDKLIYVGPYVGNEEKTRVLTALCRKYKISSDVRLDEISATLPDRCTGADLLHVTSSARSASVRKQLTLFREGKLKQSELSSDDLTITMDDLLTGVTSFKPSITNDEFQYYENLKSEI